MPEAPKYTRAQLWIIISLFISMPALFIAAWLRDMHLFKLTAIAFAASMVFGSWSGIRKMRTASEIFLRNWGPIHKDKNPILWAGVSATAWAMLVLFGLLAITTLLSLA